MTTTSNNETGRENMQMNNNNNNVTTPLAQTSISLGVARDSLLDEFERNAAEPDAAAVASSIFTPSYGQPF